MEPFNGKKLICVFNYIIFWKLTQPAKVWHIARKNRNWVFAVYDLWAHNLCAPAVTPKYEIMIIKIPKKLHINLLLIIKSSYILTVKDCSPIRLIYNIV